MIHGIRVGLGAALLALGSAAGGDEFSDQEVARWQAQFDEMAQEGRSLWTSAELGSNGVVCAQCHPNAANTHPETYPKFQKQLGRVAGLWEMINWCIRNPLEGEPLTADDPQMIALLSYVHRERRGVELAPGKH